MPIYEFFCQDCNTIFNFFSSRVNTDARPQCPGCGQSLQRQVSIFATIGKAKEADDTPFAGLDESKMESVLGELASQAETMNEDDPRQMAQMMRRFSEKTGLDLGDGMEEALCRLEAGEDPDAIEKEMGDLLESEDPFTARKKGIRGGQRPPIKDETLYML